MGHELAVQVPQASAQRVVIRAVPADEFAQLHRTDPVEAVIPTDLQRAFLRWLEADRARAERVSRMQQTSPSRFLPVAVLAAGVVRWTYSRPVGLTAFERLDLDTCRFLIEAIAAWSRGQAPPCRVEHARGFVSPAAIRVRTGPFSGVVLRRLTGVELIHGSKPWNPANSEALRAFLGRELGADEAVATLDAMDRGAWADPRTYDADVIFQAVQRGPGGEPALPWLERLSAFHAAELAALIVKVSREGKGAA